MKVVATSTAFPSVAATSTAVTIAASSALSIQFVPSAPSQVQTYSIVNLNAAVANDSTQAGVDWTICSSGCGFFTIKPAIAAIRRLPQLPMSPRFLP